jgi:tetratricopeptide (TPR) repeat protein
MSNNPTEAEQWYQKGREYINSKNYDKAIEYFDKAIVIDPKNAKYWYFKGRALKFRGKFVEAIECFNRAIDIEPDNAEYWLAKGKVLDYLERYDKAIEYFDKAIVIDPKNAKYWYFKGRALKFRGKFEEAIEYFDKAIQIQPNHDKASREKVNALLSLGKFDEAAKYRKETLFRVLSDKPVEPPPKVLETNPSSKEQAEKGVSNSLNGETDWHQKGNELYKEGRYDKAIECYDRALKGIKSKNDSPNILADILANKGTALIKLEKYDESITEFDKALDVSPTHDKALENKGAALFRLGNHDEAMKHFDKALGINRNYPPALYGRGLVLYNQGRYKEAIEYFEKAISVGKKEENEQIYYKAQYARGTALIKLNTYESYKEAVHCFELIIGDLIKGKENLDKVNLDQLNILIDTYTNKGKAHYELAKYDAKNKKTEYNTAEECFKKALDIIDLKQNKTKKTEKIDMRI